MCACPSVSDYQSQLCSRELGIRELPESILRHMRPLPLLLKRENSTLSLRGSSAPARQARILKLEMHPGDDAPRALLKKVMISRRFDRNLSECTLGSHETISDHYSLNCKPKALRNSEARDKCNSSDPSFQIKQHGVQQTEDTTCNKSISSSDLILSKAQPSSKPPSSPFKSFKRSKTKTKEVGALSGFKLGDNFATIEQAYIAQNSIQHDKINAVASKKWAPEPQSPSPNSPVTLSQYQTYLASKRKSSVSKPILSKKNTLNCSFGSASLTGEHGFVLRQSSLQKKRVCFDPFSVVFRYNPSKETKREGEKIKT
jgi:hypothetical protein